jgi:type I restriction enzyme M protein
VDWKKQQKEIEAEHEKRGFAGRFGAGLPRVNDGALLFLQHMSASSRREARRAQARLAPRHRLQRLAAVHRRRGLGRERHPQVDHRKRLARSHHRPAGADVLQHRHRHLYLDRHQPQGEAAQGQDPAPRRPRHLDTGRQRGQQAQPGRQAPPHDGKADREIVRTLRPIRGIGAFQDLRQRRLRLYACHHRASAPPSLSDDRFLDACPHLLDDMQAIDKELGREPQRDWGATWERIEKLLRKRGSRWKNGEQKLFRSVFAHTDPEATPAPKGGHGDGFEPDTDLRDFENVPLKEDIDAYFEREVRPHVPDAWMDRAKDKVGYEINFNRYFYTFAPPRPLAEIDAELKRAEAEIVRLLGEVTA